MSTQSYQYSIFDYFKTKTAEDAKAAQDAPKMPSGEPMIKEQKMSKKDEIPASTILKREVAKLDRMGEENLFGKYKPSRKPVRERNQNLEDLLHPDLVANANVTIEKYTPKSKRRGL